MNGHIVSTEAGYDVYVGVIHIADVSSLDEAVKALRASALPWNGKIIRSVSYGVMP